SSRRMISEMPRRKQSKRPRPQIPNPKTQIPGNREMTKSECRSSKEILMTKSENSVRLARFFSIRPLSFAWQLRFPALLLTCLALIPSARATELPLNTPFARLTTFVLPPLPRKAKTRLETYPNADVIYDSVATPQGERIRTIITKPHDSKKKLPV